MDFSEQYIKMCQQATEIQNLCKLKKYDHLRSIPSSCSVNGIFSVLTDFFYSDNMLLHWMDQSVWLPRQDQLQEMIIDNYRCPKDCMIDFYTWLYERPSENKSKMSFEQLWLVFVMSKKFNKIWDCEKEDWIDNATKVD